MSPRALLGLALAAAAGGACEDGTPARAGGDAPPAVALVDSVPYSTELVDGYHNRLAVRWAGRVDTVPGVLVDQPPVVVGDTLLVGLRVVDDEVVGPFAYDVRRRRLRALPVPAGWYASAGPALAPDGRHVAYLAHDPSDSVFLAWAAVAELPSGRVVYRGRPTGVLETDAGVDRIGWTGPNAFEVRIDLPADADGAVQRTRGTLRPPRAAVDTVRADER